MFSGSDGPEEQFGTLRFSQEGEDGLLARKFDTRSSGFYIDIGAHHPFRFSNTQAFYKQGWRGINVEANPEALELFKKHRPEDINLQCLVSERDGEDYIYNLFDEAALNTANPHARDNLATHGIKVRETLTLKSRRLDSILDEYLPSGTDITFMSIDVEGLDLPVLKSNNWSVYRPEVVMAETSINLLSALDSPVVQYMQDQGYRFCSYLHITAMFERVG